MQYYKTIYESYWFGRKYTEIRYALIGCGRISPNYIVAEQGNGLEIVEICDIDEPCINAIEHDRQPYINAVEGKKTIGTSFAINKPAATGMFV